MDVTELGHLRRARDLMDREYARPLDVAALARVALMSSGHFSRQFREAFGETPYGYLMTRRIERAKALLRRGDLSVTDVCMAVGCTSLGSFSTRFTEIVGESPSAYKARCHDDMAAIPTCWTRTRTRPTRSKGPVRNEEAQADKPDVALPAWTSSSRTASLPSMTRRRRSPSTATSSASR